MLKLAEADRREAVCMLADSAGRVLARDFSGSTLADSRLLEKMSSAQVGALATVCRTKLAAGIEPTELEKQAFVGSLGGSAAVMKHTLRGAGRGWGGGFSLGTKFKGMLGGAGKARAGAVKAVERGEQRALGAGLSRGSWQGAPSLAATKAAPKAAPAAATKAAPAAPAAAPTPALQGTLGAAGRGAGWGGAGGAGVGAAGGAAVGAASAEEGHRMRGALIGGALGATGGAALGAGAGATLGAGRQVARNLTGTAAQGGREAVKQVGSKVPANVSTEAAGDVAARGLSPLHYGLGALGLTAAGGGTYLAGRGYLNRRRQLQQQLAMQQATQPHYS